MRSTVSPRLRHVTTGLGLAWLCVGGVARAQTQLGSVEVEAQRDRLSASARPVDLDEVPFVTVIDASTPTARAASVADLIEREAGVRVRSRGGLGAFTSVSLRGSDANEVAIFVDGVPLSKAGAGVVDLGQLAADGLLRIEIYRGAPPVELGSEAIGGVINLVTKKGEGRGTSIRLSAGTGSFGARSASAGLSLGRPGLRAAVNVAYRGASGDFTYYDNAGTLYDLSDDKVATRHNNGFDQLQLDATVGSAPAKRGRVGWSLGAHGFGKRQGVPGIGSVAAEALSSKLTSGRLLVDGHVKRRGRVDLSVDAHVFWEYLGFSNPAGDKVGTYGASVTEANAVGGGLSGRLDAALGKRQLLSVVGETRVEHRLPRDLLRPTVQGLSSTRMFGGLGVVDEIRLWRDRLALTPTLRLDGAFSTLRDASDTAPPGVRSSDWFLSPRLGVRVKVTQLFSLRASAGRFIRFPTLIEQFGDGAFVLPGRTIRPESAWGGDVGGALSLKHRRVTFEAEGAFFGRRVTDYISFVPVANAYGAANLGEVQILGVEAHTALSLYNRARLTLDYTFLSTANFTNEPGVEGKQLPNRPAHQLYARLEVLLGPFRASYDLDYVDDTFRDAQSYNRIPGRVLHGLGASLTHRDFSVLLEMRNLADLRVTQLPLGGSARAGQTTPYPLVDYYDYPLPGRTLYATVTYTPKEIK